MHADCLLLQDRLNKFILWVSHLSFSLNVSKCSVISFSWSRNSIHNLYTLNNVQLKRVSFIKHFGIYHLCTFYFIHYIDIITGRVLKVLVFIVRCSELIMSVVNCLHSLYYALVRRFYLAKDIYIAILYILAYIFIICCFQAQFTFTVSRLFLYLSYLIHFVLVFPSE